MLINMGPEWMDKKQSIDVVRVTGDVFVLEADKLNASGTTHANIHDKEMI